jgi:hypothetical protein
MLAIVSPAMLFHAVFLYPPDISKYCWATFGIPKIYRRAAVEPELDTEMRDWGSQL